MANRVTKNGRSKTRKHDTFVALELFILHSDAWRSLSLAARQAYIEIAALYDQSNNGNLALSARQLAERLPISRATAFRAFQELVEKGFIVASRPSGFNMKTGERRATEWRLTRFRCDVTGALPTKDFMQWKPDKVHSTASPQGHRSFITEPPKTENAPNSAGVALPRSRPPILPEHDGFTTGPLLESTIGGDSDTERAEVLSPLTLGAMDGQGEFDNRSIQPRSPSSLSKSPQAKLSDPARLLETRFMRKSQ